MKETKVYVEEMPDMCLNCPCLDGVYCNILCDNVFIGRETRDPKCKLQSIKDHDRELVKEVCEDLTKSILNLKYVNDTREFATYVLSIIKSKQKDFEK